MNKAIEQVRTLKKQFKLIGEFFYKNTVKTIILIFIITIICFILSMITGKYSYEYEKISYFDKPELSNADFIEVYSVYSIRWSEYVNQRIDEGESEKIMYMNLYQDEIDKFIKSDVYKTIENMSAVDKIYYYDQTGYNDGSYEENDIQLMFANEDTYKLINYDLSDGCWFGETEQTSEYPNVVVSGAAFKDAKVGSNIEITYLNKPYTVHVIGKVASPYQTLYSMPDHFGISNTYFEPTNRIFLINDENAVNIFGETIKENPSAAIVKYKENAAESEIDDVRKYCDFITDDFFKTFLYSADYSLRPYTPVKQVIQSDMTTLNQNAKNNILKVVEFLAIGLIIFVFISVLMIRKKKKELNVLYLYGCSRKKIFGIFVSSLTVPTLLIGILMTVYMLVYQYINANRLFKSDEFTGYLFTQYNYLLLWGYLLLCFGITCIIVWFMIIKSKSKVIKSSENK